MSKCECVTCEYCEGYLGKTRRSFHCKHPNQKYIIDYFNNKKIKSMPAFIGYGENFSRIPKNKITPRWCPKKCSNDEEHN